VGSLFDLAACIIKPPPPEIYQPPTIIIPKAKGLPASAATTAIGNLVVPKGRDHGVQLLIEHLDQHAAKFIQDGSWDRMTSDERFQTLKKAERDSVVEQSRLCRRDFIYAARQFFWITNDQGHDQLFTLWESQWLVLQKWMELKRKGRAQKLMVLKGRQLGVSLLIEAMIAWRTMFFRNTEAIVVSVDEEQSAYLYGLMLHFYDKMPWWLKPEAAALKIEGGLHFDRKDRELRERNPGMNSHIYVQHANQLSGVGQGKRLSAAHVSEYTDFQQAKAKEIIEGDLLHSIHDNDPNSFGFLESTGRGAGSYSHMLWKANLKMGEDAEWYPLFLPFFLERSRVVAPPAGWHVDKPEKQLRDRVLSEWVKCDSCDQYHIAKFGGESRIGTICPACDKGTLQPACLSDEQLRWKELKRKNAEAKDKESLKLHHQETAATAEDSWQLSGYAVFDEQCQDAMALTVRDPQKSPDVKVGFLDSKGRFHGAKFDRARDGSKEFQIGCFVNGCTADHRTSQLYEDESCFIVWEDPKPGWAYSVGVDIAEGIEQDYSVIAVNKLGKGGSPDEQVAVWRSNTVEPLQLAFYANAIGRMYNEALMCVEYNFARIVGDTIRVAYQYPNLFRWKHLDHMEPKSNTFHWITQSNTKPKLWQTARHWIKSGFYVVRSPNFLEETQTFQKDEDSDKKAEHTKGAHDDEILAFMIALYCAHEWEADDSGRVSIPSAVSEEKDPPRYEMRCQACGCIWGAANPELEYRCPKDDCGSIRLVGKPLENPDPRATLDIDALMGVKTGDRGESLPSYAGYDPRVLQHSHPEGLRGGRPAPGETRESFWGK
jgi:hypothetical protein